MAIGQWENFSAGPAVPPSFLPFEPGKRVAINTERYNAPVVFPPSEMDSLVTDLGQDLACGVDTAEARRAMQQLQFILEGFCREWRSLWSLYADTAEGWKAYQDICDVLWQSVKSIQMPIVMRSTGLPVTDVLQARILQYAVQTPRAGTAETDAEYAAQPRRSGGNTTGNNALRENVFERPIFIVAAPRSGSTLLFETLACSESLWTVGGETHAIIEGLEQLRPGAPGVDSNRLTEAQAGPGVYEAIADRIAAELRNHEGLGYRPGDKVRFLEKTPKNALRIPFLNALFPDALFIFLWREPEANISSIMETWRTNRWVTYPNLQGWDGPWSLLLPPGWQRLRGKNLEEIAAYQWQKTNDQIVDDLALLGADRSMSLSYEEFVCDPAAQVQRICNFAGIRFDQKLAVRTAHPLPLSRYTQTAPSPQKWRGNEEAIRRVIPGLAGTLKRLGGLTRSPPASRQD